MSPFGLSPEASARFSETMLQDLGRQEQFKIQKKEIAQQQKQFEASTELKYKQLEAQSQQFQQQLAQEEMLTKMQNVAEMARVEERQRGALERAEVGLEERGLAERGLMGRAELGEAGAMERAELGAEAAMERLEFRTEAELVEETRRTERATVEAQKKSELAHDKWVVSFQKDYTMSQTPTGAEEEQQFTDPWTQTPFYGVEKVTKAKEKVPTFAQEQKIEAVAEGIGRGFGSIQTAFGEPQPYEIKSEKDALSLISRQGLSENLPQFQEALQAWRERDTLRKQIPQLRKQGRVMVRNKDTGNLKSLPRRQWGQFVIENPNYELVRK